MKNKIILYLIIFSVIACNKHFDLPQSNFENLTAATHSIAQLKERYQEGKFNPINDEIIIHGIVTANDQSGNFYQSIILQDATGAIPILIDGYNHYTSYPLGRALAIHTKNLYIGDYGGSVQLGAGIDSSLSYRLSLAPIATRFKDSIIEKGSFNNNVQPYFIQPSTLNEDSLWLLQNRLIQLNNYEFAISDSGKTFADPSKQTSAITYVIENCEGEKITIRNSSYSSFAGKQLPLKNGTITGILSVYNNVAQITIRDTNDVQFTHERCQWKTIDTSKITTIANLRNYFSGKTTTIPWGTVIKGKIISDTKNESIGSYRLQDESQRGIILYMPTKTNLPLDTNLLINVSQANLEQFNNELEITAIDTNHLYPTNKFEINPRKTNIKQIIDSASLWESTLIQIPQVEISAPMIAATGKTYGFYDQTASISSFVRNPSAINITNGVATAVTAYVSNAQNTAQLRIRKQTDIQTSATEDSDPKNQEQNFALNFDFGSVQSGISGNEDPSTAPQAPNLQVGSFRAVGLSSQPTASGRFAFRNWPSGANANSNDLTGNINLNQYFEISIQALENAELVIENIIFTTQRSSTGPRQWSVRTSIDNFQNDLEAESDNNRIRILGNKIFQITDRTYSSAISNQKVYAPPSASTNITIRFYAYNSESNSGSFSLNKVIINGKTIK